jgi:hypothetical protein
MSICGAKVLALDHTDALAALSEALADLADAIADIPAKTSATTPVPTPTQPRVVSPLMNKNYSLPVTPALLAVLCLLSVFPINIRQPERRGSE